MRNVKIQKVGKIYTVSYHIYEIPYAVWYVVISSSIH